MRAGTDFDAGLLRISVGFFLAVERSQMATAIGVRVIDNPRLFDWNCPGEC
jgi:hypothetical protein